jgi:methionine-rich copper-binding protein CopC
MTTRALLKSFMRISLRLALVLAVAPIARPVWASPAPHSIAVQTPGVSIVDGIGRSGTEPPNEIAVDFDHPIDIKLVKLEVVDERGVDHSLGAPMIRADHKRISVRVAHMGPGIFSVRWGVVDTAGERIEGAYTFTFEDDRILGKTAESRLVES